MRVLSPPEVLSFFFRADTAVRTEPARSIYTRKWSATSLCSGILAGLVGITPAAGYVGTPASLAIGFVTAVVANYATGIKILLKVDDAVDTFALHAIGGFT